MYVIVYSVALCCLIIENNTNYYCYRCYQTQLSRLKEQMDTEAEDRLSVKTEESRTQELMRRLQRQVRDLEEELADVRRKDSESAQRKQDLVC